MDHVAECGLEHRWLAALNASRQLQAQSDELYAAMKLAEMAWQRSAAQLAQFESLRDELERRLVGEHEPLHCREIRGSVMSAA